jgi:hypothetical protein
MEPTDSIWQHIILPLLTSFTGAIAGALIAFWSMYKQVDLGRQVALQTWYQDHYITKGIEPIHSYVLFVKYILVERLDGEKYLMNLPAQSFPIEAINRLFGMLNPSDLPYGMLIVNRALSSNLSEEMAREYFVFVMQFEGWLSRLHRELLKMKLQNPDQIHNIIHMQGVNRALKRINDITREARSGPIGRSESLKFSEPVEDIDS